MNDSHESHPVLDIWCDLECPDCHRAQDDLRAVGEHYGEALEIRWRHFPLEKHTHAYAAAQAAEEADAQGKGQEYIKALLERTSDLTARGEAVLTELAAELGLDVGEFESALIDGRHLLAVDADYAEAKAIGVTGTPTYVIDGERLDGGKTQEGLRERIEEITDRLLGR
ncbi:DsbA family protein [Streptomyces sp. N2-109]|uniref:DsbA family protein n=1 Tax=Streptomyces gossypii TaxID=2883101 RepID=A0ABT2JL49_9ACTN|nr:DsbA family protein [Streptomyces gossypii]MCT2588607.1 DsbA family protein [Streptomyces gossypii]